MEPAKKSKAENIFSTVLPMIKPSASEINYIIENTNRIMTTLKGIVPENVTLKVVGSIAKSTNLKGSSDIDIFMLFESGLSKEVIVKKGLRYAKSLCSMTDDCSMEVKYAEHPYARLYFETIGMKLDLVPAYKVRNIEERGTAVDRSPLHTDFINKNLTDKQRDDVRLLKYMLKMHMIYGAEIKTKGFSGYLCELLIHNFGSILKALEFFATMELPVCIMPSIKGISNNTEENKRFKSDFVVIDPVDKNRNVAAAVSLDSLAKLSLIAKRFLKEPRKEIFYGKGFALSNSRASLSKLVKKMNADFVLIKVKVRDKSEDIVWPQLNRYENILVDKISKHGFIIFLSSSWINGTNGYILLLTQSARLKTILKKGPLVFSNYHVLEFIKAHKDAHGFVLRNGELFTLEKAKYETPASIAKAIIKERVMKSKDLFLDDAKILKSIPKKEAENAYAGILDKMTFFN
jgi:tRNA nucleotidyltransferase (CCA-adding enzyme)